MLFFAGILERPGEVHHGNTVMDYMEQERQRGITIRAATTAFNWQGY
jgi:elongation factor G